MEIQSSAVWEVSRAEGMGRGAGGWRCGGHGPRTPKLKASLAAGISSTILGLTSPKEGSLSIAPNHSGEPGPSYPPTSQAHVVFMAACTCRSGL